MLKKIRLLRSIGKFHHVDSGLTVPLAKLTLFYAENGRGKTTLAAIFRSLASGNPIPITERRRLNAVHPPHIVLEASPNECVVFEDGRWSSNMPDLVVFDDIFVAQNIYSGLSVEPDHRQRMHDLILGARGVELNERLKTIVDRIEGHNEEIRRKAAAISESVRGVLSVDQFCALEENPDVEKAIAEAVRELAAKTDSDAVKSGRGFPSIEVPEFSILDIRKVLRTELADIDAVATERVESHLEKLGGDSESWVHSGVMKIEAASVGYGEEHCPLCTQSLNGVEIIRHFRSYF